MTDFTFTSPEGKEYTISGPPGATEAQAFQILQQQLKGQPSVPQGVSAAPVKPDPGIFRSPNNPVTEEIPQFVKGLGKGLARGAVSTYLQGTGSKPKEIESQMQTLGLSQPNAKAGDKTAETLGSFMSPMPGGIEGGVEKAAAKAIPARQVAQAEAALQPPVTEVTRQVAKKAADAGYKFSPSYIGGGGRKLAQSVAGGPKTEKEISEFNEAISDRLAKKSIGLGPTEELSSSTFETLKDKAYAAYEKVRGLGKLPLEGINSKYVQAIQNAGGKFAQIGEGLGGGSRFKALADEKDRFLKFASKRRLDAGEALDEIRALRKQARANLKNYDPEKNALGAVQRDIAEALQTRIEDFARRTVGGRVVKELEEARTQLAKITNIEDSLGAGGHVRAADFKRMLEAKVPLSDELKLIGEMATQFPKNVQNVAEQGAQGVWSAVDYLLGGTGIATGHPAVATASLARPALRGAISNEGAQRSMIEKFLKSPTAPKDPQIRKLLMDLAKNPKARQAALSGARQMLKPSDDSQNSALQDLGIGIPP